MKKQKPKSKFNHQNQQNKDRKQQLSLLSFFSAKPNTTDDVSKQNDSPAVSHGDEERSSKSNSSSPDIIEQTPQSKSLSTNRLSCRLNFALPSNGDLNKIKTSRKKLFLDSSNKVIDEVKSEENELKSENNLAGISSKRFREDAVNELLEELENSLPSDSAASQSKNPNNFSNRKRLKLISSKLEGKNFDESPQTSFLNKTEKRCSQNILVRKIKPRKVVDVLAVKTERQFPGSVEPKVINDGNCSIDIENLGELLGDDFDSFVMNELDLSSWAYCEVTMIEKSPFGIKTQLKEIASTKEAPLSTFCYVRGYWGESALKLGDLVSIKARYDHSLNSWLVDENNGFVVKYPNLLLTGTSIVGSLFCLRKAVLNYLFPGLDPPNFSMFLGSLVHELFQEVLKNKLYKEEDMKLAAINLLSRRRTLLDSYECGISLANLQVELNKFLPRIVSFMNMYILNKNSRKMWAGHIEEILSIEENFWIPHLGIKGKTDLIVKAKTDAGAKIMPVELKTGRPTNSVEHRGQIILYLMMMTESSMNVDTGLLLYLKDNIMHEIIPRQGEMNGLVTIRNNLVDYFIKNEKPNLLSEKLFSMPDLPEPINHHSACSRCPYLTVCSAALSKESNVELSENNPLRELSVSSVQHLSSSHIEYVFHWLALLRLEESEKNKGRFAAVSDIWFMNPEDRRIRGCCIPRLKIINVEIFENFFLHHMKLSEDNFNLMSSEIGVGDYIVVSTSNRYAVATGFVDRISETTITLKLDRELDREIKLNYIVDKCTGTEKLLGFNSSNLLLLLEDSDTAAKLRNFIIDLKLPTFAPMPCHLSNECSSILSSLNFHQKNSILKVLSAENFTLIKGLPGTGKTATIIALIKILVRLNYSVLITSHTHSAVDNVLVRLKDSVDFLRLGSSNKVHSAIKSRCEDILLSNSSIKSTKDVENFYNQKQVVGVTCMGCSHSLLLKRFFDFCIIDEATQVLQPSILKALHSARKFVLIGDPDQLPPVVHNFNASRLGLSESLFHRLDRPEVTTTLHLQYRMNSKIMKFANAFAYQNQLKCDNGDVNCATIQINDSTAIIKQHHWLKYILSSNLQHSLVFLSTANMTNTDSTSVYSNQLEVDVTYIVIDALKKYTKKAYDIGIIAPYREQVQLLRRYLSDTFTEVEINTVDQFQGRDRDVIIFSSTRWSNQKEEGILGDKRRLTVAITRAKRKLIIIGNESVLQGCSTFNKLLACIPSENVVNVEKL